MIGAEGTAAMASLAGLAAMLNGYLPALLLKATLVLALGFGASRLMGSAPASARHQVWGITLVVLLALPLLQVAAPAIELPLLPAAAGGSEAAPGPPGSLGFPPDPEPGGGAPAAVSGVPDGRVDPATNPSAGAEDPPRSGLLAGWTPASLARAIWAAGALLVLAYLGIGLARVALMLRRAEPLDDFPEWRSLIRSLETSGGRPVRLCRSRDVEVPFTWGFLRPAILLPWEAADWPEDRKRDALVHELSHVDRLDWLTQLSARLVCALYWFHPLVWIASRNLFLEAERTCDDRVLAAGARSHDYAQHLLELAARMRASRVRLDGAVAMARRRQLPVRIEAILDEHLTRSTMTTRMKIAIGLLTMAPALLLASAHLTQARPDDDRLRSDETYLADRDDEIDRDEDVDLDEDRDARFDESAGGNVAVQVRRNVRFGPTYVGATEGMTPLMMAAAEGDIPSAARLIDVRNGTVDVNEGVSGLGTPLILAANNGHYEMVRFLLDRQADPNRFESGPRRHGNLPRSPLGAAARSGDERILELLLDRGADPNRRPGDDASPLMIAAQRGHFGACVLLLDRGADVNERLSGEGTPLIAAARGGNTDIVRLFLDRGADPRASVAGDGNALTEAARHGNTEAVGVLLDRGADPDDWVSGDESGFFHALRSGSYEMIRDMVQAGADVNAVWDGDGTPLIVASRRGEQEIVDLLLDAGANPDVGVDGDGSPLIQAAARGDSHLVARLVENGADVNQAVEGDGSPLIMAARSGDLDTVEFLVAAGADVNRIVPGDENPLMNAAEQGHLRIVRYLAEHGADIHVKVREHGEWRTAMSQAMKGGHRDVVDYLRQRGARE